MYQDSGIGGYNGPDDGFVDAGGGGRGLAGGGGGGAIGLAIGAFFGSLFGYDEGPTMSVGEPDSPDSGKAQTDLSGTAATPPDDDNKSKEKTKSQSSADIENKANHIFGSKNFEKHNLVEFLSNHNNDKVAAYRSLTEAAREHISITGTRGVFNTTVEVNGSRITIFGHVNDSGVIVNTAYIAR